MTRLTIVWGLMLASASTAAASDGPEYSQLVATALQQGCLDTQQLATTIQQQLHPTGGQARMASLNALPTAGVGEVLVKIRVDYQGGLGADRFVELAWSFSRYGGGNLNVVKDNGIAGVDSANVNKLGAMLANLGASKLELCVTRLERDLAVGSGTGAASALAAASENMSQKVLSDTAAQFAALAAARDIAGMRSVVEAPFVVYGVSGNDEKLNRECTLESGGLTAKTSKDIDAVLACVSGRIPKLPLPEGWTFSSATELKDDPAFVNFKAAIKKLPKNTNAAVTAEWGDCRHAFAIIMGSDGGTAYVRGVFAGSNCPTE